MAKAVELAQGNRYSRSSEGGGSVDTATRTFKVVRDAITETINIPEVCGIDVGDAYSEGTQVPCVGWESVPDGDSRMVLIVTFRYRSTPGGVDGSGGGGGGGGGGGDPRLQPPESRPALYTLSSALQEIPATGGYVYDTDKDGTGLGWHGPAPFTNSVGNRLESLTKLEPVVTATITQYSYTDQTGLLQYTGYINSDEFTFSGHTVPNHACMFQGLSVKPYVESGFRGFQVEFQFVFRINKCEDITFGDSILGWDKALIDEGFRILNSGLDRDDVDQGSLHYEIDQDTAVIKSPKVLRNPGEYARAHVPAEAPDGGESQQPSAQPVALNRDGTPRARTLAPRVIRAQVQPEMTFGNNFSAFGINSFY